MKISVKEPSFIIFSLPHTHIPPTPTYTFAIQNHFLISIPQPIFIEAFYKLILLKKSEVVDIHFNFKIFSVCAPPSLVRAYYLQPPDARAIFLHNDLLCNDTCSVTGGSITYWGGTNGKDPNFIYSKGFPVFNHNLCVSGANYDVFIEFYLPP